MVHILTTCTILMGRKNEMLQVFEDLRELYIKRGAKYHGSWWTLGGNEDEISWLFEWKSITAFQKSISDAKKDQKYPIEELASIVISLRDKILV